MSDRAGVHVEYVRDEKVVRGKNGRLFIGADTPFQFKTTGDVPLEILIATVPRWPGPQEAIRAEDHWPTQP